MKPTYTEGRNSPSYPESATRQVPAQLVPRLGEHRERCDCKLCRAFPNMRLKPL